MVPVVGQCQSFKLPEKVSFSSPEVCHKFDKDVIACANSLELQSPKDESPNFRKVSKFLTDYQKGCSNTNYIQYDRIEVVFNESPWFRIFYLAGWLRYGVQNNAQPNKMSRLLCAYAGMKTVIKVYNSSRNGRIDNNLDELVTADNKGKLKSWLEEKMN
jgi:hypothetical protein